MSNNDTALQTATGTPFYLAPEISHFVDNEDEESGAYTNAVDIWSFACVIYQIMALQVPFFVYPRSLLAFCRGGDFPEAPLRNRTSKEGIEFIKSVLVPFPARRPTAQEAMLSKWPQEDTIESTLSDLASDFSEVSVAKGQTDIVPTPPPITTKSPLLSKNKQANEAPPPAPHRLDPDPLEQFWQRPIAAESVYGLFNSFEIYSNITVPLSLHWTRF